MAAPREDFLRWKDVFTPLSTSGSALLSYDCWMLARDESVRLLLNLFLAAPVQVSAKVLTFSTRGVESKALLVIFSSCHGVIIVHLA